MKEMDLQPSQLTYERTVEAMRELLPPGSVEEAIATYTRIFERAMRHTAPIEQRATVVRSSP